MEFIVDYCRIICYLHDLSRWIKNFKPPLNDETINVYYLIIFSLKIMQEKKKQESVLNFIN